MRSLVAISTTLNSPSILVAVRTPIGPTLTGLGVVVIVLKPAMLRARVVSNLSSYLSII